MRLRFSIRDLLWLTLVVALALGWWIDRNKVIADLTKGMQNVRNEIRPYIIENERISDENERLTKRIETLEADNAKP